jgi:hypothetical protein
VSSLATSPADDRPSFQRFASGFGRTSAVLSVIGLLLAVGLSVPTSWFDLGGREQAAAPSYTDLQPADPVRLGVTALDLAAPLVASDLGPREALVRPPIDAPLVTWWNGSARPGATTGQTILLGHATGTAGGLTALTELGKGAVVDLLTRQGTIRYEVATVRTFDPAQLERSAITLFKQDGGAGRLVMISAEAWDGTAYERSVVVTATRVGGIAG